MESLTKLDCEKWMKNKKVNPITGKRLIEGKGPYNLITKHCNELLASPKKVLSVKKSPAKVITPKSVKKSPAKVVTPKSVKKSPAKVVTPKSVKKSPVKVITPKSVKKSPVKVVTPKSVKKSPAKVKKEEELIQSFKALDINPVDKYSKYDSKNCSDYKFKQSNYEQVKKFIHLCNWCKGKWQIVYPENIHTYNDKLDLILDTNKAIPYYQRKEIYKTVKHAGQRKLLMAELELLTRFVKENNYVDDTVVLYVGAGPGHHLECLIKIFKPFFSQWILYDPVFSKTIYNPLKQLTLLKTTDNKPYVDIYPELFKHVDAERIKKEYTDKGKKVIFISDIRRRDGYGLPTETEVQLDMADQKDWYQIIKPVAGQFKFRLPWEEGKTVYFEGDIYLPVWGKPQTTESRLTILNPNPKLITYDNKTYESKMFYFNKVERVKLYKINDIYEEKEEYCHCHDCSSEIKILSDLYDYMRFSMSAFPQSPDLSVLGGVVPKKKDTIFKWVDTIEYLCDVWKNNGGEFKDDE